MTTVGSNIGQLIVPVTLLSMPSPQVSETGGGQATLVVPLVVPVTLLSTPSSQVSETGGGQATLVVPVALLSTPPSQVSETGGGTGYVSRASSIIVYAIAASIRDRCRSRSTAFITGRGNSAISTIVCTNVTCFRCWW